MKEIRAVLLRKEQQVEQLQKEIEALRLSIEILEEDDPILEGAGTRGPSIVAPKEKEASSGSIAVSSKQFP